MRKNKTAEELAIDLAGRSRCSVRVGSVIIDKHGRLVSWGWNGIGSDGMGLCAEAHALSRGNRKRLAGSDIYVAGFRTRTGRPVTAKPCQDCQRMLDWAGIRRAFYYTKEHTWEISART